MAGDDDEVTPPGWYRQADDPTTLRWWDGEDWTDETMPVPAAAGGRAARAKAAKAAADGAPATPPKRRTRADAMAEAEEQVRREAQPDPQPDADAGPDGHAGPDEDAGTGAGGAGRASGARGRADRTAEPEDRARRASGSRVRAERAADPEEGPAVEILLDPGTSSEDGEAPPTPRRRQQPRPGAGPGYVREPATVRILEDDLRGAERAGGPDRPRRDPADDHGEARDGDARRDRPSGGHRDAEPGRSRPPPDRRTADGRAPDGRPGARTARQPGSGGRVGDPRRGPAAGRRPTIDQDRPRSGSAGRGARTAEPAERTAPPVLKVLLRAGLIAVLLAGGWIGYVRLRDAQPEAAATLGAEPQAATVRPDAPRLDQIVLTLADLPRGWSAQAVDPSSDDICDGRVPRSVIEPTAIQSASFTRGEGEALIGNTVEEFVNTHTARAFMDLTAEVIESCREYTADDSTITLAPFDFPAFGDDTFVARVSGTAPGGELHGAIVYLRVDNRVSSVVSITFGEGDVNKRLIEELTRLVARRMSTKPQVGALPGQ